MRTGSWICCQLGARQHYANARTLQKTGNLYFLITDAWVPNNSFLAHMMSYINIPSSRRLRQRFHIELSSSKVFAFNSSLIRFELQQRIKNNSGWKRIIARNNWFQSKALQVLHQIEDSNQESAPVPTLLSYSYSALELFRYAKSRGWRTVLEQIDPGPIYEEIVQRENANYPQYTSTWEAAPSNYWTNWREECFLADYILVNSDWTARSLTQVGIPATKISKTPLIYEKSKYISSFDRKYPTSFSSERPLRVLFLGIVSLRKGIGALLEAAEVLQNEPVEFWLVGPSEISPHDLAKKQKVRWYGSVTRSETATYYQNADIFLFPTLSDGFGLTQLEAQAWRLPVIASRFCGEVVRNGVNGMLLKEVSGQAIVDALRFCIEHPGQLNSYAQQAVNIDFNQVGHLEPLLSFIQKL